jgi:hypothetical protein
LRDWPFETTATPRELAEFPREGANSCRRMFLADKNGDDLKPLLIEEVFFW